jgi:hypothetical protein
MVTRIAFLLALLALFLAGCSGGDDGGSSAGSIPSSSTVAPRPTTDAPAGPRAVVEPHSGPPGIEITVRGSGWEPGVLIDVTGELPAGSTAAPYETVVSNAEGSFTASFRLENAPDGSALSTGRYNLIARSPANEVSIPFLVETRRPIGGSGPQG